MMIYEALSSLGVPVCHPPYKGAEETYITYQLLGQSGQFYAEGGEAETGVQIVGVSDLTGGEQVSCNTPFRLRDRSVLNRML